MSLSSALSGEVTLPGIGAVPKKALYPIAAVAVGYVGYRYYAARQAGTDPGTDPASDFTDGGLDPSVIGAVSPDNSYGLGGGSTTSDPGTTSSYGFSGTTNAQWTQYALTQLEVSDTWSTTDILAALGAYLSRTPLTAAQLQIVNAAVAIAGYPPVGGSIPITTVPPGTDPGTGTGTGGDPGTGTGSGGGGGGSSGGGGGSSSGGGSSTSSSRLATAAAPAVSAITRTGAHLALAHAVAGATSYTWFVNGVSHGSSIAASHNVAGLKPNTAYKATVIARSPKRPDSFMSPAAPFKTKK